MKNYHYLSNAYVQIQGIDEVEEYNNTIKAMHIMGMNNEDISCKDIKNHLYCFSFSKFIINVKFSNCTNCIRSITNG